MMKHVLASTFAIAAATLAIPAQAAEITLPTADTDYSDGKINALLYGDFTVYSLAYLNFLSQSTAYDVKSGPGQIQDLIVVATGSSGTDVTTNDGDADDAFATPNSTGISTFTTSGSPEPGGPGEFIGDVSGTWDISIPQLNSFLSGDDLVFFFNLNQTNSDGRDVNDLAYNQDLLAYAMVTVRDDLGVVLGTYELGASLFPGNIYDPSGDGVSDPYDFGDGSVLPAYVHGAVCVADYPGGSNDTLHYLGKCADAPFPAPSGATLKDVNQNLGADTASFAVTNTALSSLLRGMTDGSLSIDLRLGELNNGFEQLFIGRATYRQDVPEPAALGLLGLGLAALALRRRKR